MKNKIKTEADSLLRIPKSKNKLGLKIHKIAMPHDDLIRSVETPRLELVENITLPSHTSISSQTRQTRQTKEIAPIRDFQKTPNSITRRAIPDGLFKGKSKQLYDALYSLTRGAIIPTRNTRVRKSKLMKLANIGSRATFDSNINHLQFVGLISETILPGEHEGNKFEVFLPEEISLPSQSSHGEYAQKQDSLVSLETSQTRQSLESTNTGGLITLKTSLKTDTKNDDDRITEAFSAMTKRLDTAVKKLTGKGVSKTEAKKWEMLADLLILEMEAAASRTSSISSAPAFLTEVLRRKLLSGNSQARSAKSPKVKVDTVGKPNAKGEYEKKPLDKQGREAALLELRDFAEDDFLQDFKKWYTEEDWQWLIKELGID